MTNTPNNPPTPPTNRPTRRRLTADELIAIVIALTGIGTVFFWGIGQKNNPLNLATGNIATINKVNGHGELAESESNQTRERKPIAILPQPDETSSLPGATAPGVPVAVAPIAPPAIVPVPVPPVATPAAVPSPVASAPVFQDIPKELQGYIGELQKLHILDDFGDGKFDPGKPVTRGEYAKMLDRAFPDKPAVVPAISFKDIPANYPRKDAIDRAVKMNFMSGYSPSKFSPDEVIPRYQMQISLAKGMNLPVPADKEGDKVLSKFDDATKMPKYARGKVAAAVSAELVVKDKAVGKLGPVQSATRADAAALIYQALVKEGKLPPNLQAQ
jgi:hypothetical protein